MVDQEEKSEAMRAELYRTLVGLLGSNAEPGLLRRELCRVQDRFGVDATLSMLRVIKADLGEDTWQQGRR